MSRRTIEGKYDVVGEKGTGGMGRVFQATDTTLGRTVALKFLKPELTGNEKARTRFQSEMKRLAKLNHNNLARIYASGQDSGQSFMVMEFVEGPSLEEVLKGGPMPLDVALPVFFEVLDGIDHAHATGVVHRDLKPSNILLTPEGHPKVIDFGIGLDQESERLTIVGDVNCTPAYASPEQASGRANEIDRVSDVYSLGAVLFEMLTGSPPLDKGSTLATLHAHVNEDVPPLPDGFSPALVDAVSKSLARDKKKRHQTTGEFRAALESAVPQAGRASNLVKDYLTKTTVQSKPTVMELSLPDQARPALKPRGSPGSARRRFSWMIYASAAVLLAAAVVGAWVLKEVRERLATPVPPPAFEFHAPPPPPGWDIVSAPKVETKLLQAVPKITKAPASAPVLSADDRRSLELRRDTIASELKKYSAELKSLRALNENQPRQSELEKLSASLSGELETIEKKLSGH